MLALLIVAEPPLSEISGLAIERMTFDQTNIATDTRVRTLRDRWRGEYEIITHYSDDPAKWTQHWGVPRMVAHVMTLVLNPIPFS